MSDDPYHQPACFDCYDREVTGCSECMPPSALPRRSATLLAGLESNL